MHGEVRPVPDADSGREKIFIDLMTSDRKLEASREGSKARFYGT